MHLIYTSNAIDTKKAVQLKVQNKSTILRKKVLFILIITVIVTIGLMFGTILNVFASENTVTVQLQDEQTIQIHVKPGDTLWSIAKSYVPKEVDIRYFISKIKEENQLQNSNIIIGQALLIPNVEL
ncbi:LysM peptidoglycan-binding domain-containing protein [Chengkuizengella sediminis]|uniref:LysM peptidoglycan-binding domain-containing protein n=1 Tax=Chengkuizengella sediminis TaxID=1885917 RepID=UPI00138A0840|nr:LysM peptidoglycan-binding domain-containing protein [Chengkuizengella sediminis]NDI35629.1 LysM peptidoglycan-binding domain-containing protein [Chengkuizengella sediminis]